MNRFLKYHDHIAAYMWCNLRECSSNLLPFQLEKHEAYLTYAYTFKAYRGKNLAPHLRYQLYVYLAQIGRTKLYSITKATSTPARRFKEKLKAKPLKFYLHVKFFKRLRWNILLKDYTRLQLWPFWLLAELSKGKIKQSYLQSNGPQFGG